MTPMADPIEPSAPAVVIQIQPLRANLDDRIPLPRRMSAHGAGFDIAAALDEPLTLAPGGRALVPSGFAMAIPPGFEGQIRPRSGLAHTHGVTVLNAPGTIDADYRGEVKVLLVNLSTTPFVIEPGARIAQLVVAAVAPSRIEVVTTLDTTARGTGGFGSTGS